VLPCDRGVIKITHLDFSGGQLPEADFSIVMRKTTGTRSGELQFSAS
jgi:hypothetical protein